MQSEGDPPSISVIIPTLNEEKLISRSLNQFTKALKEKYKLEIIISDGGSTDSTLDRVSEIADKIAKIRPGVKQNIPIGRNEGARKASGKFFYFVNADTVIKEPDRFFETTLEAFKDPKTLAITCSIKVFPEEEKLSDKIFHTFYNLHVRLLNTLGMGMGRGECQIMRREIFERLGGYNEHLPAGEDYDLYRRIKRSGKIKCFKDLTVYESPRRYRKYGYSKVFWEWTKNSLSILLFNKAASKEWEAIR